MMSNGWTSEDCGCGDTNAELLSVSPGGVGPPFMVRCPSCGDTQIIGSTSGHQGEETAVTQQNGSTPFFLHALLGALLGAWAFVLGLYAIGADWFSGWQRVGFALAAFVIAAAATAYVGRAVDGEVPRPRRRSHD